MRMDGPRLRVGPGWLNGRIYRAAGVLTLRRVGWEYVMVSVSMAIISCRSMCCSFIAGQYSKRKGGRSIKKFTTRPDRSASNELIEQKSQVADLSGLNGKWEYAVARGH
jgi:hypothetical protein